MLCTVIRLKISGSFEPIRVMRPFPGVYTGDSGGPGPGRKYGRYRHLREIKIKWTKCPVAIDKTL
jgi:hypothetical protein